MNIPDVTAFNTAPYYDDFNTIDPNTGTSVFTKNYHRILFQPAYAVQTRELNQLQTMLQHQIAQLGASQINANYGGSLVGGNTHFENLIRYIDVKFDNPLTQDVENNYTGIKYIETRDSYGPAIQAEVLSITSKGSDEYRIWFKYITSNAEFAADDLLYITDDAIPVIGGTITIGQTAYEDFRADENVEQALRDKYAELTYYPTTPPSFSETAYSIGSIVPKTRNGATIPAVGWGFQIVVDEGIFMVKGCFVHTPKQSNYYIITDRDETVNGHIAFIIDESVTTVAQDQTLRDNANGSFNYAAPGADRYTIKLTLSMNTTDAEVLALNDGISPIFNSADSTNTIQHINVREIVQSQMKEVEALVNLSRQLEEYSAQRTNEESGNYTVTPFLIKPREYLQDGNNGGRYTLKQILQNDPFVRQKKTVKELYYDETGDSSIRGYTQAAIDDTNETVQANLNNFKEWLGSKLAVDIDPAIAYVEGFRVEPASSVTVLLDKARTTAVRTDVNVPMLRGGYIDVVLDPDVTTPDNIATILTNGKQYFRNIQYLGVITPPDPSVNASPSREGWLKFRIFVYNDFNNADGGTALPTGFEYALYADTAATNDPIEDRSIKSLKDNTSVFPLPNRAIKDVRSVEYVYQKSLTSSAVGNSYSFTLTDSTESFISGITALDIVAYASDATKYIDTIAEIDGQPEYSGESQTLTITFKDASGYGDVTILAPVQIVENAGGLNHMRTKIKQSVINEEVTVDNSGKFTLANSDVILSSIVVVNSLVESEAVIQSHLVVDDGLSENFYDNPLVQITEPEVAAEPPGEMCTFYVSYDYFNHTDGHYFIVNSYPVGEGTFDYEDIPKFGNSRLSDFIDFRVKRNRTWQPDPYSEFEYDYTNVNESIHILPNGVGQFTFEHYLARKDLLVVDTNTNFFTIKGIPAVNPFPPKPKAETMSLYEFTVNPYTYDELDLIKTYIDNKRYTMRDIGNLEKRIATLEYYTSLSLLEKEAQDKKILDLTDDIGVERFKNGTLVDSFISHNTADTSDITYLASIDTTNRTMGPYFQVHNYRMRYTGLYDTDAGNTFNPSAPLTLTNPDDLTINEFGSTVDGIIRTSATTNGVNPGYTGIYQVSLDKGEREILFENLAASQTKSVQPYELAFYPGRITLSPQSDEWVDTQNAGQFIADFGTLIDPLTASLNNLSTAFNGPWGSNETLLNSQFVGTTIDTIAGNVWRNQGGRGNRQLKQEITTTRTDTFQDEILTQRLSVTTSPVSIDLGDRLTSLDVIPYIRSRDIMFKGKGFQPNTTLYLFFDRQNVTAYAKNITKSEYKPYAYTTNVTIHTDEDAPAGYGALTTDAYGEIYGTFRIPNNDEFRFLTGWREFKLIDNEYNNESESDTFAITQYTANGLLASKQSAIATADVPFVDLTQSTEVRTRDIKTENKTVRSWDPVAQTFRVSSAEHVAGVFITDIDVYFATKSADDNITVTGYIVPCENGIPTTTIVPGSEVVIRSGDISLITGRDVNTVDENGNVQNQLNILDYPTRFTFKYPVHLKSDVTYAFILFGETPEFRVWTSVLGQQNLIKEGGTFKQITKNSAFGVLLQSQNKITWTPFQDTDLTMRIHKAVYPVNETTEFKFSTFIPSSGATYPWRIGEVLDGNDQGMPNIDHTYLQLMYRTLELPNTDIKFQVQHIDSSRAVKAESAYLGTIEAGQPVYLKNQISSVTAIEAFARLVTSNRDVTPVINCENASVYVRDTQVNNPTILDEGNYFEYNDPYQTWDWTTPDDPYDNPAVEKGLSRYITKKVTLNNPSEDLRVILAVNRPSTKCNIHVYAKRKPTELFGTNTKDLEWYKMGIYSVGGNVNNQTITVNNVESNFVEVEYILPIPDPSYRDTAIGQYDSYGMLITQGFTEFQIKVVFTSSDKCQVCKIKDLRAIASI